MTPRYTRAAGIAEEGTAHVRALLSVANREGLSAFARELQTLGVELVATDGTREHLAADGIDAASVSELTAVPPLVGGQVRPSTRRSTPASSRDAIVTSSCSSSPTTASA